MFLSSADIRPDIRTHTTKSRQITVGSNTRVIVYLRNLLPELYNITGFSSIFNIPLRYDIIIYERHYFVHSGKDTAVHSLPNHRICPVRISKRSPE